MKNKSKSIKNVFVDKSKLSSHNDLNDPNHFGLFANINFKKGEIISYYKGTLVHPKTKDNSCDNNKTISFQDGYKLKCNDDSEILFVKDCIKFPFESRKIYETLNKNEPYYDIQTGFSFNSEIEMEIDTDKKIHKAYLVATNDINKGDEIYCHFGFLYWFDKEMRNGFLHEKEYEEKGFPYDFYNYKSFELYLEKFYKDYNNKYEISEENDIKTIKIHLKNDKYTYISFPKQVVNL